MEGLQCLIRSASAFTSLLIVNNQSETPVNDTTKDCRVIGEKGLIKCKELKTVNDLTAALPVSGSLTLRRKKKVFFYFFAHEKRKGHIFQK